LENVVCCAEYSERRLFCPRAIYPYWREIWLKRIEPSRESTTAQPETQVLGDTSRMMAHSQDPI